MRDESYIGIDPGSSTGGICLMLGADLRYLKLADATQRDVFEFIVQGETADMEYDGAWDHRYAVLERVSAMPKQGVSSTFKFGVSFGELRMALVAAIVPFELVTPAKWQGFLGCRSKGDKNVTKRKAQELFPGEKMTHWKADATLLAEYARRIRA